MVLVTAFQLPGNVLLEEIKMSIKAHCFSFLFLVIFGNVHLVSARKTLEWYLRYVLGLYGSVWKHLLEEGCKSLVNLLNIYQLSDRYPLDFLKVSM